MRTEKLIADLRTAMQDIRTRGKNEIAIENLEAYLTAVEEIVQDPQSQLTEAHRHELTLKQLDLDNKKWEVQSNAYTSYGIELFRAVIEAGQTAIKSAMLMNGGAAVALLAFLGNLLTRSPNFGNAVLIARINTAMLIFLTGVGLAGLTSGFRYVSQALYADRTRPKRGDWARNLAVLLAFSSLVAFLVGGLVAYTAISP